MIARALIPLENNNSGASCDEQASVFGETFGGFLNQIRHKKQPFRLRYTRIKRRRLERFVGVVGVIVRASFLRPVRDAFCACSRDTKDERKQQGFEFDFLSLSRGNESFLSLSFLDVLVYYYE